MPAPLFSLPDSSGNIHQLTDYKGKVVYIDLWASWCSPCRAESPFLDTLIDKYRNNSNINFVSIAVHDGKNDWLEALKEDKPSWLQLIDSNNQVSGLYDANLIPKFLIIDKEGKIVNADAPRPSEREALEKILLAEINKPYSK